MSGGASAFLPGARADGERGRLGGWTGGWGEKGGPCALPLTPSDDGVGHGREAPLHLLEEVLHLRGRGNEREGELVVGYEGAADGLPEGAER